MLSVVAARLEDRPEIPGLPLLVPLAALVFAALLTRWWRRDALTPSRCVLAAICCVYCVGLLRSVLFPYPLVVGSARTPTTWGDVLQLVPLATVPDDPSGMILNIVLFVPLGALAGLLLPRPTVLHVVAVGFLVSLAIELTQLVGDLTISTARIADVDDLIGNTVGAAVGFGLLRLVALLPVIARLEAWLRSGRGHGRHRPSRRTPVQERSSDSDVLGRSSWTRRRSFAIGGTTRVAPGPSAR